MCKSIQDEDSRDGQRIDFRDTKDKTISLNVVDVWRRGFTGRGVAVSVLDDGLEKDHPDLKRNYVSSFILEFFSIEILSQLAVVLNK